MSRKILVVDDDPKTVELIKIYLEKDNYQVLVAYNGRDALALCRTYLPDLLILDLMLPMLDGLDVCKLVRSDSKIPIIMLTARSTEEDKLLGLNLGADDYLTKPFSPKELVARVRVVLRRTIHEDSPNILHYGQLEVNFFRHEVSINNEPISLTPKEFKLLETFMRDPGRAFTRLELLEKVFGLDYEGLERTIDVHMMNLRKKIEPDISQPLYIQTIYGVGYKFGGN